MRTIFARPPGPSITRIYVYVRDAHLKPRYLHDTLVIIHLLLSPSLVISLDLSLALSRSLSRARSLSLPLSERDVCDSSRHVKSAESVNLFLKLIEFASEL